MNEGQQMWSQFASSLKGWIHSLQNFLYRWTIGPLGNLLRRAGFITAKKGVEKGVDAFRATFDNNYAMHSVKRDGKSKDVAFYGPYNKEEMMLFFEEATRAKVPFAIEKFQDGDNVDTLDAHQVNRIANIQRQLKKLNKKMAKHAGKGHPQKLATLQKEINAYNKEFEDIIGGTNTKYNIIANVSRDQWASAVARQIELERAKNKGEQLRLDDERAFQEFEKSFEENTIDEKGETNYSAYPFAKVNSHPSEAKVSDLEEFKNYGNYNAIKLRNLDHFEHVISKETFIRMVREDWQQVSDEDFMYTAILAPKDDKENADKVIIGIPMDQPFLKRESLNDPMEAKEEVQQYYFDRVEHLLSEEEKKSTTIRYVDPQLETIPNVMKYHNGAAEKKPEFKEGEMPTMSEWTTTDFKDVINMEKAVQMAGKEFTYDMERRSQDNVNIYHVYTTMSSEDCRSVAEQSKTLKKNKADRMIEKEMNRYSKIAEYVNRALQKGALGRSKREQR